MRKSYTRLSPRATLTHLSCSPNFPSASITRYTHAKHEQIRNFQELRCVTTLITWLSSNVRYVTCSYGTDCPVESPSGRVQCFKMAKIDPVSSFYPTL